MAINAEIQDADQPKLMVLSETEQLQALFNIDCIIREVESEKETAKAEVNELNNRLKKLREEKNKAIDDIRAGQLTFNVNAPLPATADTTLADDDVNMDDYPDELPPENEPETENDASQDAELASELESQSEATEGQSEEQANDTEAFSHYETDDDGNVVDLKEATKGRKARGRKGE